MDLQGIVHNGVVVPDDPTGLTEGARVRIIVAPEPPPEPPPKPFGERFSEFKGAAAGLPADLADQHDHHRLGTPKR